MKYYKFKKITKGSYPIIRVTYKNWYGKYVDKDVCKCGTLRHHWIFMEDGNFVPQDHPINVFNNGNADIYFVNGE